MEITLIGKYALWMLAFIIPLQLVIAFTVAHKSNQSAHHYFTSGKQLPLFLMFFLDFACVMGVGNFIGYAGKGYEIGLAQFWMMFGEQGTKVVFALTAAGIAGRYAYSTLNEYMQKEFYNDKWLRMLGGVAMTGTLVAWVGAQSIGLGSLISVVMGMDPALGIWIASITAVVYTSIGGMWGMVWTDVVQGSIRVVIGFAYFATIWFGFGGLEGIHSTAMTTNPQLWSFGSKSILDTLALFITPIVGVFTMQEWWQRCFSAKNSKTAMRGFLYTAFFAIVMCSASILMGIAAHGLNPHLERPDMAFGYLLTQWLHPVMGAALVVTIIGADMTVCSGFMNSAVTLIVMDIVQPLRSNPLEDRKMIRLARWLTFIIGLGAVWVAFHFPSVLSAALWGYTFTGAGFFLPLVLGMYWKNKDGKTYVTKNAAIASAVIAGTVAVVIQSVPGLSKMFGGGVAPGLVISLLLTVGISLFEHSRKAQPVELESTVQ